MANTIEVKFKWFPIVTAFKSPNKFRSELEKQYARAGRVVGMKLAALMRKKIRGGKFAKNSGMTTDMKGSTKPLVDSGRLFKSVAFTSTGKGPKGGPVVTVGVFRTAREANVAIIVSRGATITVTPKMSRFFKALHAASTGRKSIITSDRGNELLAKSKGIIPALKVGTTLVIPPRNFALATLKDPLTKEIVESEFNKALALTFKALEK